MNIAVINIKDLIKYALILAGIIILIATGIIVIKGKEEFESSEVSSEAENSSFLYCLDMEMPLMANGENEDKKGKNTLSSGYKILDTQLAMLYNIDESQEIEEEIKEEIEKKIEEQKENEGEQSKEEENRERKVEVVGNVDTKIIDENNITASFTDNQNNIQVKNQSKYDIKELLNNSNYELKNKNKVIIYHTHTCESYTSSEKYNYEMTGAYRTTDLNYTVSKVR